MRYAKVVVAGVGMMSGLASCGEEAPPVAEAPKFVRAQQQKVAEFKAKRGLVEKPEAALSVNDRLAAELRRIRAAVSQYSESSKSLPWRPGQATTDQWNPLGFATAPLNPLSPEKARGRLIEITRKGATGAEADPNEAGWVWNSADGRMFAAGSDE